MTHRDLYFATYHQAAHVVTALVLGCRVDYVDIGTSTESVGWNLESASLSDTETVCAAGFEMERILGRMHDSAWGKASTDRVLLGSIHADRTGLTLSPAELNAKFMMGATSSRPILDHQGTRNAIDQLAESLGDAHGVGKTRLMAEEIKDITGLVTGVGAPK